MSRKSKREDPSPPPPKRLYLSYESSSTGGQRESDEPYSCRSPEYITVTFKALTRESGTFFGHNIDVTDEVYAADEVFLVVVRYSDGDSFGSSHGHWTVWEATASEDDALKVAQSIEDGSLVANAPREKYYSFPWTGYFSRLEGVEIHAFRVGQKTPEDKVSGVSIHRH